MENTMLANVEIAVLKSLGQTILNFEPVVKAVVPNLDVASYKAAAYTLTSYETGVAIRKFRDKHGLLPVLSVENFKQRFEAAIEMNEAIEKVARSSYEHQMNQHFARK